MTTRRLTVIRTKEVPRQNLTLKRSHRDVARSLNVSAGVVGATVSLGPMWGSRTGMMSDRSPRRVHRLQESIVTRHPCIDHHPASSAERSVSQRELLEPSGRGSAEWPRFRPLDFDLAAHSYKGLRSKSSRAQLCQRCQQPRNRRRWLPIACGSTVLASTCHPSPGRRRGALAVDRHRHRHRHPIPSRYLGSESVPSPAPVCPGSRAGSWPRGSSSTHATNNAVLTRKIPASSQHMIPAAVYRGMSVTRAHATLRHADGILAFDAQDGAGPI